MGWWDGGMDGRRRCFLSYLVVNFARAPLRFDESGMWDCGIVGWWNGMGEGDVSYLMYCIVLYCFHFSLA